MKRIKSIGFLLLGMILFIPVFAKADSINVSSNKSSVIVGNNFNVSVKITSPDAIGSFKYTLTYDSSVFKLVGGDKPITYADVTKDKSVTYTYTFKALKSGSGTFGIKTSSIRDYATEAETNPTSNSITVKTMTQAELEATYSKNADLKVLSVDGYEITPAFDKDTLEYSLTVPNDVEKITISAAKADNTATINGTGEKDLVEGNNKFEVVVTAQKGNTKTYVLNIERKELDPIYVEIDKVTYSLIRKAVNLPELTGFSETTVTISETEIPALYSEITKYTVVGVKDGEGKVYTYIYNDGKYQKYFEVNTSQVKVFIKNPAKAIIPDGYTKTTIKINEVEVDAYQLNKDSKRYLVYGVNVETGDECLFIYDSELNSITTYDDEYINTLNDKCQKLLYVSLFFIALFLITMISFIIYIIKKNKKVKNVVVEKPKKSKKKKDDEDLII